MVRKYIITAKNADDILSLSRNTRSVDLSKVKWNWANIFPSSDLPWCDSEDEVLDAVRKGDFRKVDDMIMGGDVPVGAMVVVTEGKLPRWGFVCGNGIDWFPVELKHRQSNAIVYDIFSKKGEGRT